MAKKSKGEEEKMKIWKDDEVEALIRVWADPDIQRKLQDENNYQKNEGWKKLLRELNEVEFVRCTMKQLKNKLTRLRSEYEKAATRTTGDEGGEKKFQFWDQMHPILASRHSSHPPRIRDTMDNEEIAHIGTTAKESGIERDNSGIVDVTSDDGDFIEEEKRVPPKADSSCAVKTKSEANNIRYNPYHKRGARKSSGGSETDKLIQAMKEIEEKANVREDKRDQLFVKNLGSLQQSLVGAMRDILGRPAYVAAPSQVPPYNPSYGPSTSGFNYSSEPIGHSSFGPDAFDNYEVGRVLPNFGDFHTRPDYSMAASKEGRGVCEA